MRQSTSPTPQPRNPLTYPTDTVRQWSPMEDWAGHPQRGEEWAEATGRVQRLVTQLIRWFVGVVIVGVLINLASDWVKTQVLPPETIRGVGHGREGPDFPSRTEEPAEGCLPARSHRPARPVMNAIEEDKSALSENLLLPCLSFPPPEIATAPPGRGEILLAERQRRLMEDKERLAAWEARLEEEQILQNLAELRLAARRLEQAKKSLPPAPADPEYPRQYFSRVTVNGGRPVPRPVVSP